ESGHEGVKRPMCLRTTLSGGRPIRSRRKRCSYTRQGAGNCGSCNQWSLKTEATMTGRLIPCIGQDGEFASDRASRQAACKWLGDLLDEGKRWSEARGEIAQYYAAAGMEERIADAKSKGAKELIKPWPPDF